jgi:acetyl-CoA carboxylase carboxyltransferase component
MEELVAVSPADGLVGGLAKVWGRPVVLAAYDYTVFAGTQGAMNHKKQDRLFSIAAARSLPVVLFAEGGGGRPGDVDFSHSSASQLDVPTFATFARLRERVPLVVMFFSPLQFVFVDYYRAFDICNLRSILLLYFSGRRQRPLFRRQCGLARML